MRAEAELVGWAKARPRPPFTRNRRSAVPTILLMPSPVDGGHATALRRRLCPPYGLQRSVAATSACFLRWSLQTPVPMARSRYDGSRRPVDHGAKRGGLTTTPHLCVRRERAAIEHVAIGMRRLVGCGLGERLGRRGGDGHSE